MNKVLDALRRLFRRGAPIRQQPPAEQKSGGSPQEGFITCPLCAGQGAFVAAEAQPCPQCHGRGVLIKKEFAPHTHPTPGGQLPWEQLCSTCRGTGHAAASDVAICAMCHGTGQVPLEAVAMPPRSTGTR
jgi:DnaJ-class molecular chaperone